VKSVTPRIGESAIFDEVDRDSVFDGMGDDVGGKGDPEEVIMMCLRLRSGA